MCGPIKIWKYTAYISGGLFAAFGIILMALSIWIGKKEFAEVTSLKAIIMVLGIGVGISMLIMGLLGFVAVRCQSRCCLCAFLVFLVLVVLCVLILWLVAQLMQSDFFIIF